MNFGANGTSSADNSDINVAKLDRLQQELIELELIHKRLERKVTYLREEEALVNNRLLHQQANITCNSMVNNSSGSLTWTQTASTIGKFSCNSSFTVQYCSYVIAIDYESVVHLLPIAANLCWRGIFGYCIL